MKKKKTKRIGWKIVEYINSRGDDRSALLKLEILGPVVEPIEKAVVRTGSNEMVGVKKLRTSKVKVLQAFKIGCDYYGEKTRTTGKLKKGAFIFRSKHDYAFIYRVGDIAKTHLNTDPERSCAPGLHFFNQRRHAIWWANA